MDPGTERLDYDAVRAQARQFRPLVLVAGYSAYPRNPDFAVLREIADEVGATFMVDMAHFAGLVAGGVLTGDLDPVPHADVVTSTTHKSLRGPRGGLVLCTDDYAEFVDRGCPMVLGGPMPHVMAAKAVALAEARTPAFAAYARRIVDNAAALAEGLLRRGARLVTGGTDNHLVLVDVTASFGLTGRQAESALLEAGVVTNRNSVPADPNGAWYTSGVRLGHARPDHARHGAGGDGRGGRRDRHHAAGGRAGGGRERPVQGPLHPRRRRGRGRPGPGPATCWPGSPSTTPSSCRGSGARRCRPRRVRGAHRVGELPSLTARERQSGRPGGAVHRATPPPGPPGTIRRPGPGWHGGAPPGGGHT